MRRRELLRLSGALTLVAAPWLGCAARAAELPAEVAGIALPRTPLAAAAAAFARARCPDYLFNHCMRTFLFGALQLARERRACRCEEAFVGAALHDLGLLPEFESPRSSFEIDGANAAERWVRDNLGSAEEADLVWHAVEMHDGAFALTRRQGPEAMLVALGAGIDVYGPEPGDLEERQMTEVLAAFPRLQFKRRFTALLIEHCQRKPDSQRATWLEGVCRAHVAHPAADDAVERHIAAAPFAE
ncbi:MAG TPA: hypothetical protein VLV25_10070 [Steroidobacteraceae bacterium]|nr:hypothetical protein [Steroidobacteraceae bacterium]